MSRIPVREALVASGTVSAVVSLCIVGSIAASASEAPESGHPAPTPTGLAGEASVPYSPLLSPSQAGDRSLIAGSYRGVWFGLPDGAGADSLSAADALAPTTPAASTAAGSPSPTPTHTAAPAPVHEQSRTSVSAAISGGNPRDIAQALAATYTWTGNQWTCLDKLWSHESKYETTVRNPTSGAYGIPQALPASKMGSAGADWRTNPVTQIVWGLGYIQNRYGSPCNAWSYWLRHYSY
ncbi:MAG TPA: hypothetical protein VFN80_10200 [Acidothermaceae bacterium]|nr:hypothetical protein [Acidothermaceae bacterium]